MTERIRALRDFFITQRGHHPFRRKWDPEQAAKGFRQEGLSPFDRACRRLTQLLEEEKPLIFPEQRILFVRTIPSVPELFSREEEAALRQKYHIHERGDISNICVDYETFLTLGLPGMIRKLEECYARAGSEVTPGFFAGELAVLRGLTDLVGRYRDEALRQGNPAADTLSALLKGPPETFAQSLQLMRIVHFTMWLGGNYHNTLGRIDCYLSPWLERDLEKGLLTEAEAFELLEEFFLTFNLDSDLYPGMQQGDNGQSIVLGGCDLDGQPVFNRLSRMALEASLELRLIDPKVNLRVSRKTPLSVYELGTRLTSQGLGFPQYSNDDVVIPGLIAQGYAPEDARNYAIAACWEFIIPKKGMEIVNIDALSFAEVTRKSILEHLSECGEFDVLLEKVCADIRLEAKAICEKIGTVYLYPAPFLSLMMEGCVELGRDISEGCVYNNYGIHGTGLATAADSLASVEAYVYGDRSVPKQTLCKAMETDFEGEPELLHKLRFEAPKMGCGSPEADCIGAELLEAFADGLEGLSNDRGGHYRAGTGSAMYYLWHAKNLGATPDGRRAGEPIPANFSPSLFARCPGPVSVLHSFSAPNLQRTINGGPLTIELHDTLFRTPDSISKVAALIRSYILAGGHQIQINAVNRDRLLDAQRHPEQYRNLIVRVWGWSGYFVELDREYQDHIIRRTEYQSY